MKKIAVVWLCAQILMSIVFVGANISDNSSADTSIIPGTLSDPTLVGQWDLDEGTGTIANDTSWNGNNGTLANGPIWAQGIKGSALQFDGINDQVDCGNNAVLDLQNLTISLWVKPGSTQVDWANIIDKHDGVYHGFGIEQWDVSTNQYSFTYGTGSAWCGQTILTQLHANEWHYLTVTKNGNEVTHYLDGVQSANGICTSATIASTPLHMFLGRWANGGRNFNGMIDEIRIWSRALNATEVDDIYHSVGPVQNIGTDRYFTTIQAAIDDAQTLNGHTIKVNAGTYHETVNVTKSLTLVGENMATTIVNHSWVGFTIFADNVSISNFTIIGITGFQLDHSNRSRISSINVKCYGFEGNNSNAVDLYYSNNNTISNITASGLKSGIVLLNSDYNTIIDNNLFDNHLLILPNFHIGNGIYLQESRHNTFFRNTITDNDFGMSLNQDSTDNVIYHNNFTNNLYQSYESSSNHWDNGYPGGGNYWSDYSGVDHFSGSCQNISGSDGFGDTPFTNIYGGTGAQDSYPLMKPIAFAFSNEMISFQSGWNLISFPTDDPSINGVLIRKASDLANQTSPTMVSKWNPLTQTYINFIPGFHLPADPENFIIGPDDAVFIFTSAGSSHSVFGYISTAQRSANLRPGWNMIGYHSLSSGDVEADWAVQVSCSSLDDICYWDGTTFRHYIFPGTVMELTPGKGYFVWSDSVTTLVY